MISEMGQMCVHPDTFVGVSTITQTLCFSIADAARRGFPQRSQGEMVREEVTFLPPDPRSLDSGWLCRKC